MAENAVERVWFNNFPSGYYSNRNPLAPPSDRGEDAAINGGDMVHTDRLTWLRRPGITKWSDQSVSSATRAVSFFGMEIASAVKVIVDRVTDVYEMTSTTATVIYNKAGFSTNAYFTSIGDVLYLTNYGAGSVSATPHRKRIANGTAKIWGIVAPTAVATITNATGSGVRVRIGWKYVYVYKDSTDGHISSASPISESTGKAQAGNKIFTVTFTGTAAARVDKVDIYRTKDGGSTFFFHSSITNPGATTDDFDDLTLDDELNSALIAPIATNGVPPEDMSVIVEHAGRIWGIVEDKVFYNGDTTNGIKEESWPTTNFFKFSSFPRALLSNSQGLLVFTAASIYLIEGILPEEFRVKLLRSRLGVMSPFCVASDGDIIYIYSTFKEVLRISDRVENIGLPLNKTTDLTTFDPSTAYLAIHREGNDGALYLSDNAGKMFRFGFSTETWSPVWNFGSTVGGAIGSIQTSPGDFDLLVGPETGQGGFIWKLNDAVYTDDGTAFTAPFLTFGNFMLVSPGAQAWTKHAFIEQIGSDEPTCAWRAGEIGTSAAFTTVTSSVNEPPTQGTPTSVISRRYHLDHHATAASLWMRHCQIRLTWTAAEEATELLTFGLNYTIPDTHQS